MNGDAEYRLRLAGIGGQKVVSLANTLANAAFQAEIPVISTKRPRSAMRLGPITCDLIFNYKGFTPFIPAGEADAVLGTEFLDGLSNAERQLKNGGLLILNEHRTLTIEEALSGIEDERAAELERYVQNVTGRIIKLDALREAMDVSGNARYMHILLLGVLVSSERGFPVPIDAIKRELRDDNALRCFERGIEYGAKA